MWPSDPPADPVRSSAPRQNGSSARGAKGFLAQRRVLQRVDPAHGVGERGETPGLAPDDHCGFFHLSVCGHLDELRAPAHDGEGGSQVVGEGGVHASAVLRRAPHFALRPGEFGTHVLEAGAQPPELVVSLRFHVEVEVSVGDLGRRFLHGGDGAGDAVSI